MHSSKGALLLGLAILSSAATIPPIDNINLSDENIPVLNASALGAIDSRFTMTHQYSGPALDEDQCLMNVVYALSQLSVLSFISLIEPIIGTNPRYPDVVVVADTLAPGRTIETRIFIWGLYAGATVIVAENVFQTVEFMLQWDGITVGRIRLMVPAEPSVMGGRTATASNPAPLTVETFTNDSYTIVATNTPDNPTIDHFEVFYTGFRKTLPKYAVDMSAMKALVYIAEKNVEDELQPFATTGPRPYNAILRLTQYVPRQPRVETFSYLWASRVLPTIPDTLLRIGS